MSGALRAESFGTGWGEAHRRTREWFERRRSSRGASAVQLGRVTR